MPCSMAWPNSGRIERWSWLPQTRCISRQRMRSRYGRASSRWPKLKSPRIQSVSPSCTWALIASSRASSWRRTVSSETRQRPRGSDVSFCRLAVAQLLALDLARGRLGQCLDKLDLARALVRRHPLARELLQRMPQRLARLEPRPRHHERLDYAAADLIRALDR